MTCMSSYRHPIHNNYLAKAQNSNFPISNKIPVSPNIKSQETEIIEVLTHPCAYEKVMTVKQHECYSINCITEQTCQF